MTAGSALFADRQPVEQVEPGNELAPRFYPATACAGLPNPTKL
ncbi:MAG: hypothetical protein QM605_12890 [Sphingobium sp.]